MIGKRFTALLFLTLACLKALGLITATSKQQQQANKNGPSCFPLPSDAAIDWSKRDVNNHVVETALKPVLGQHRPDSDAIFAMAGGYPLETISQFVGLLLKTGYDGDIVLGTQSLYRCDQTLRDYLKWHATHSHLVVYEVEAECQADKCTMDGMYQRRSTIGNMNSVPTKLKDPRKPRFLALLRYELYWIWSLAYAQSNSSRIMLIDSRDVYFQTNPLKAEDGIKPLGPFSLHVYQEISKIDEQEVNSSWIRDAYGQDVLDQIGHNYVLCSGSTLGGAKAIELYSRAMVEENDADVTCVAPGCDQGHHNYLVHSGRLSCEKECGSSNVIPMIVSHAVGQGEVLTVGLMVGGKLEELELVVQTSDKDFLFYNTNGQLAPVVHQLDRDKAMFDMVENKAKVELDKWKMTQ